MRDRSVPVFVASLILTMSFWSAVARAETWSVDAPMAEPRAEQTATLLPDGEVLVAGGYTEVKRGVGIDPNPLALAQLFDPSTHSWVQAEPMRMARDGAKAALLADGSVLVVGGTCPFLQYDPETSEWTCDSSGTAEAYDPTSNTWDPVAAPSELQSVATLTALADGRVLLIGLFGPRSSDAVVGAAVYDPGTNGWSIAAKPLIERFEATATLMDSGDVLVAGGSYGEKVFESVEEYDPETNEWTMLASMRQPRTNQAATLLPDGSVLMAGGDGSVGPGSLPVAPQDVLPSVEVYDPATNTWQAIAPMNLARSFQTATALPGGDVLMVGGQECNPGACLGYGDPEHPASGDCCAASSAEVYEPSSGRWKFTEPITSGMWHTATLLQNGEVLVAGGEVPLGSVELLSSAYVYGPDPASTYVENEYVLKLALEHNEVSIEREKAREAAATAEAQRKLEEEERTKAGQERRPQEEREAREQTERTEREVAEREAAAHQAHEAAREAKVHQCVVPSVKGESLKRASTTLHNAHCRLGRVLWPHRRHTGLVVVSQNRNVGNRLPAGTDVAVRLGSPHRQK